MMQMATELSISSSFGLPFPRHSSFVGRRRLRFPATAKAELQSAVGLSDRSTASAQAAAAPVHSVTVHDRQRGVVHQFLVPEDQYILHTAESQNISLPFACRHGCCTSCAVRVKSGEIRQPEALGISAELKSKVHMTEGIMRVMLCYVLAFLLLILKLKLRMRMRSTGSSLDGILLEDLLKGMTMHWNWQWAMSDELNCSLDNLRIDSLSCPCVLFYLLDSKSL